MQASATSTPQNTNRLLYNQTAFIRNTGGHYEAFQQAKAGETANYRQTIGAAPLNTIRTTPTLQNNYTTTATAVPQFSQPTSTGVGLQQVAPQGSIAIA
jgi:hypothetical protein